MNLFGPGTRGEQLGHGSHTFLLRQVCSLLPASVLQPVTAACNRHVTDKRRWVLSAAQEFKNKITSGDFLEWEEVYTNHFYGTLNSELSRIWSESKIVIFDVDVKGGINIKEKLGDAALSVFVMPPSIEELENRLRSRKTESEDKIKQRISKANEELQDVNHFDVVLENDNFDRAVEEAESIVQNFIDR